MAQWIVRSVAAVFPKPDTDPNQRVNFIATLNARDRNILNDINRTTSGDWLNITTDALDFDEMWIRAADVVEANLTNPIPVDLFSFVAYTTVAAEDFNVQTPDAVGVSRDYVLAWSLVRNEIEQTRLTDSVLKQFNPFQFNDAEWQEFLASGSSGSVQSFDIVDPLAQVDAAVFFAAKDAKSIAGVAGTDPVTDPYFPNSIDLFLTRLLGATSAVALLKDKLANVSQSRPWSSYVAPADLNGLQTRFPKFLSAAGVNSVADLCALIQLKFDAAYVAVAQAISDALPEDPQRLEGDPPWMEIARQQLEFKPAIASGDKRVLDYFAVTDDRTATATTAWCAAFVSFCLNACRVPIPPRSDAWAPTWSRYGKPVNSGSIPVGAIVTVSPTPKTDQASHVAFYAGDDGPNRMFLLGGNQGRPGTISRESFPRSWLLHIRWPDDAAIPAAPGAAPGAAPPGPVDVVDQVIAIGSFTSKDWENYCTVLGMLESSNMYRAVNRLGYCGRWQFGEGVLEDQEYVKHCPQRLVADKHVWLNKDHIDSRDAWCSSEAVQDNAMLVYTRGHYQSLKKSRVLGENSPKSDIAGYLAAAHLLGPKGASDLKEGKVGQDANGTTSKKYFNILSTAFK
jgi:hypothetical protein